jgi:enolase
MKVNQIGTITQALDMAETAYAHGYGVMPCNSRGEGTDIADYCVGVNAATVRESCLGHTGNRFLAIEAELGQRAVFPGKGGLKGAKFA